jgi:hypothetical protein
MKKVIMHIINYNHKQSKKSTLNSLKKTKINHQRSSHVSQSSQPEQMEIKSDDIEVIVEDKPVRKLR